MASGYFNINYDLDTHDVKKIKRTLDELKGVTSVTYSTKNRNLAVDFDDRNVTFSRVKKRIENMGYDFISTKYEPQFK